MDDFCAPYARLASLMDMALLSLVCWDHCTRAEEG